MKLTDKCKEDFEKWFWKNHSDCKYYDWKSFAHISTEAMQFGVIQDFADSVGINIEVAKSYVTSNKGQTKHYGISVGGHNSFDFKSRPEARTEAVKQFNNMYNEQAEQG